MYALIRAIIDDVLMAPALAPFTTFGLVILIALSVVQILTGEEPGAE